MSTIELRVNTPSASFEPVVCGDIVYESEQRLKCSKLSFEAFTDLTYAINAGDRISLRVDGENVFLGIVFSVKVTDAVNSWGVEGISQVVVYDQMRYLRNKDTYIYSEMRASDVVRMIALDYKLRLGEVQQTDYVIPYKVEDNVALSDIVENAIKLELENSGRRFVLFDDFGQLTLRSNVDMFSGVVIDKKSFEGMSFVSSIDKRSNRVKVSRFNAKSGQREIVVVNDVESQGRIGVLQHYAQTGDRNVELGEKADSLLRLFNANESALSVSNALGSFKVRGGKSVDVDVEGYGGRWNVVKCVHKISGGKHLMDLQLVK